MRTKINFSIVRALAKRDLRLYFSSPSGYVFITLFIFLSAAAAFWQDRFFLDNLANLDQLNQVFPILLLLFIPALTMSVWSEERRLGTAELLFTLPATDLEIVLGKYFATLGIYTASLVLSLSHVAVLFFLGSPDLGLMLGNYIGFWLVGAALVPVGMLASMLTANMPRWRSSWVPCSAAPSSSSTPSSRSFGVDVGLLAPGAAQRFQPVLGLVEGRADGVGAARSSCLGGRFLHLPEHANGRPLRHWPREAAGYPMWSHHTVRDGGAGGGARGGQHAVVARATFLRLDVTAERLSSLSAETRRLIAALSGRPGGVHPGVSEPGGAGAVRAGAVEPHRNVLEEIDALAGSRRSRC